MSFHFAYGRTTLDSDNWSITVNNSAGNLTATSKYFSLQGQNAIGKNKLLISSQIIITANSSVTISINSDALTDAEGWTHYVIGVSDTNTESSFNQIARIPIFNYSNGDINVDSQKTFPLTITFSQDVHLATGLFLDDVEDLPTTNLLYGMRRGITALNNNIYEYNPNSTQTPNGTSILAASTGNWIQKSTFSTYIENINGVGGCARNILALNDFDEVEYVNYDADGNTSLSTYYYLLNDSGIVTQPNTGITPTVQLGGVERTELFDNKIYYEIIGIANPTTGELRTLNSISNQTLEYIGEVQVYSKDAPYTVLTDYVQAGEAVLIKVHLRFMGIEFNNLLPTGYFQINFGFILPTGVYTPTGSLFEKGIIFNKYNNRRIYPGLANTAIIGEGAGIVKNFSWYSCNSTVFDLAENTANQKLYVNTNGTVFIDIAEKNDSLLRGIVDTTAKESILSEWSDYIAVNEDDAISVLVNYDADDDFNIKVREDYPDVIADDWAIFNPSSLNIYIQKETGGEIRKFANNLIAPTNGLQEFIITDWANGVVVDEEDLPDTVQSFFNPIDNDVAAESAVGDFTADNYRVAHSYYWDGSTISDISHDTGAGCIGEALLDGEAVFGNVLYPTKAVIKAIADVYDGMPVYCKETNQQYIYRLTGDFVIDDLYVLQPDSEIGYWVSTLYNETHTYLKEVAPTVDDDETLGYQVGDKWLYTVEEKEYTLIDATEGAAVWKEVGGGGIGLIKNDGADLTEAQYINFGDGLTAENDLTDGILVELDADHVLSLLGTAATTDAEDYATAAQGELAETARQDTDDVPAAEVSVDASGFSSNLSTSDTDLQTALETIDGLDLGSGGGHTIEEEGTPLTQRAKLNFVGANVTVTDDEGDDATVVTINGIGIIPRGAWDNATAYVAKDAVEYLGSAYIANASSTNKVPGVDPEWDLWVEKGDNGATGTVSAASGLTLEHITTPAAPSTGNTIVYAKADGKIYKRPAGGSEEEIGSGGASAYADLTDVDTSGVEVGQTMVWNGTVWVPGVTRKVLNADRTYYVRPDGSDSNDGLSNTAGGAFLTPTKARDVLRTLDGNGFRATVKFATGTYSLLSEVIWSNFVGFSAIYLEGDKTTPTNVLFTSSADIFYFTVSGITPFYIEGFHFTNTGNNNFVRFLNSDNGWINHGFNNYGATTTGSINNQYHIYSIADGKVSYTGNYTISGKAYSHLGANKGSFVYGISPYPTINVTLTGTPSFNSFLSLNRLSMYAIYYTYVTYSGSATGKRYDLESNSVSQTGGGDSYFPGNATGTIATGGQYT